MKKYTLPPPPQITVEKYLTPQQKKIEEEKKKLEEQMLLAAKVCNTKCGLTFIPATQSFIYLSPPTFEFLLCSNYDGCFFV